MALLHIEPLPRRAGKSDVLALLDAAGLDRRRVGRIELHGKQAVVEIPDGWEARLVKALDGRQFGDRRVRAWTSSSAARPAPATKTTSSGWRGCWTWKAGPRPKRRPTTPGGSRPKRPSRPATP